MLLFLVLTTDVIEVTTHNTDQSPFFGLKLFLCGILGDRTFAFSISTTYFDPKIYALICLLTTGEDIGRWQCPSRGDRI